MAGEMLKKALVQEKLAKVGKKGKAKKGISLQLPLKSC